MHKDDHAAERQLTLQFLKSASCVLSPEESQNIEITDLGLNRRREIGLQIVVYVNTPRVCAKELVLFPNQICPEHRHPQVMDEPGKEETFRCRWGLVYLYLPGEATPFPKATVPADKRDTFTVWKEIILKPGEQFTIPPDTLHWFQAGPERAVLSEFSTKSRDEFDIFTDSKIRRISEPI